MNKLNEIISRCKASVTVDINNHKDCYRSVITELGEIASTEDNKKIMAELEISEFVFSKMNEKDTIISVQFYPYTPIGSFTVYHYDLDKCLDEVIKILDEVCE